MYKKDLPLALSNEAHISVITGYKCLSLENAIAYLLMSE